MPDMEFLITNETVTLHYLKTLISHLYELYKKSNKKNDKKANPLVDKDIQTEVKSGVTA